MRKALAGLAVSLLLTQLCGCGGAWYALSVNSATSKVEEARALQADQYAPYEYYYAKEHLQQAQVEAAEASYSDAARFAETAEEYAQKAIELTQTARRARK